MHLIIVRHGNTFRPGETPTRVGRNTDLPLVEEERAKKAARHLRALNCLPDRIFAAPLQRTLRTAELIRDALHRDLPVHPAPAFAEIDYGPDENKNEDAVRLRLGRHYMEQAGMDVAELSDELLRQRGEDALALWNDKAIPPYGWHVDVKAIVADWKSFAAGIGEGENVLLVSSNGIIRFAPSLLSDEERERLSGQQSLKVTTGGVCVFAGERGLWRCLHWNLKP